MVAVSLLLMAMVSASPAASTCVSTLIVAFDRFSTVLSAEAPPNCMLTMIINATAIVPTFNLVHHTPNALSSGLHTSSTLLPLPKPWFELFSPPRSSSLDIRHSLSQSLGAIALNHRPPHMHLDSIGSDEESDHEWALM
jgi:hypothetical protein